MYDWPFPVIVGIVAAGGAVAFFLSRTAEPFLARLDAAQRERAPEVQGGAPTRLDELVDNPLAPFRTRLRQLGVLLSALGVASIIWHVVGSSGLGVFLGILLLATGAATCFWSLTLARKIVIPPEAPRDLDSQVQIIPALTQGQMVGRAYTGDVLLKLSEVVGGPLPRILAHEDRAFLTRNAIAAMGLSAGVTMLGTVSFLGGATNGEFTRVDALAGVFQGIALVVMLFLGTVLLFKVAVAKVGMVTDDADRPFDASEHRHSVAGGGDPRRFLVYRYKSI